MVLDNFYEDDSERKYIALESDYVVHINPKLEEALSGVANATSVTTEAYFGKNPFVMKFANVLKAMQKIFHRNLGKTLSAASRTEIIDHIKKLEQMAADHFNVEEVTITLVDGDNLLTYPVYVGKLDLSKYHGMTDKEAKEAYEKIVIDNSGIHFDRKEGKRMIIFAGSNIMASKMLSEFELAALLIHEIGHSFYSYRFGFSILYQRAFNRIKSTYDFVFDAWHVVQNMIQVYKTVKLEINTVKDILAIDDNLPDDIQNELCDEIVTDDVKAQLFFGGRGITGLIMFIPRFIESAKALWKLYFVRTDIESKEIKKNRADVLKSMEIRTGRTKYDLFIGSCLSQFIEMIDTLIMVIACTPLGFVKLMALQALNPLEWIRKTEEIASDAVANAYGLGPELANAIIKLRHIAGIDENERGGFMRVADGVPVLGGILQFPKLVLTELTVLSSGYPSDRQRIKVLYNDLVKELNSPYLSKSTKRELKRQLDELSQIYNDYIDPEKNKEKYAYARAFIYWCGRFIIKLKPWDKKPNPPSYAELAGKAIEVTNDSSDLIATSGIKGPIRKLFNKRLESIVYVDKTVQTRGLKKVANESVFDMEYEHASPLPKYVYDDLRKKITFESYFGQTPLVKRLISRIHRLRQLMPEDKGKMTTDAKNEAISILEEWGNDFAKEFNVETCSINLVAEYNAFAVPFFAGNYDQFQSAKENEMVETPTGFKYKNSKNMHIIMQLGINLLLDDELSDSCIAGIIFHELGHGFEHFKIDNINKQRADYIFKNVYDSFAAITHQGLTLNLIMFVKNICNFIYNAIHKFDVARDRTESIPEFKLQSKNILDTLNKTGENDYEVDPTGGKKQKEEFVYNGIIQTAIYGIGYIIKTIVLHLPIPGIAGFIAALIEDPFYLFDLIFTSKYFKRERNRELFADSFAVKYGLGEDLSEFFKRVAMLPTNVINPLPILKQITQFNYLTMVACLSLFDEHPSDVKRMKEIIRQLEKELLENNSLSKKAQNEIKETINKVSAMYEEATSPKSAFRSDGPAKACAVWAAKVFMKCQDKNIKSKDFKRASGVSDAKIAKECIATYKNTPTISSILKLPTKQVEDLLISDLDIVEAQIIKQFV